NASAVCGAMLLLAPAVVRVALAQAHTASSLKLVEEGRKSFAEHCSACHGPDAAGADMGPRLAGTRRLRTRTIQQLRTIINQGMPSSGMPAFHLPAPELDTLAGFVRSLNSTAAETPVPGVPMAGREFFFGKGNCASCHMVHGNGKALGPDLSNVGHEMTVGEIRQVLRDPASRITPGYELVSVRLRDGNVLRGFARGRTNFDLQLQDLDGHFHMLQGHQIASVRNEKDPVMKPVQASPEELRDLVAYLSNIDKMETAERTPSASAEPGNPFARIQNPEPGDWLTYNGKLDGNRYSDLKQINTANVRNLAVKWIFPIDHFGLEVTPIVADGVMYITGPNQAIALDALTGRQIWKYSRPRSTGLIGDASLGTNRGLAILGGKVFMVTDNAHLLAINKTTGSLMWDVYMPEEPQHYGSTVAPLPVKDNIVAGVSGGDRGIRGFLASYKASTGERVWRRWTIPLKGDPGSETWKGKEPIFGGGATWLTGAYDPEADTLYWPTGNPWPDSDDRERGGDNLYSNCILAIDPATGNFKWHFQFTPHDVHDWDATEPPLLVNTKYAGQDRKLLLHADRNGFFYVLDRITGKMLLASSFVHGQTWTQGIDPNGRPLPPPAVESPIDCPSDAANWDSAAFSPVTRLFYVLTMEQCRARRTGSWKAGEQKVEAPRKILRAINIDTGKVAWDIPFLGSVFPKTWPGVMATAGGLVFYGDPNGAFAAADERNGKTLWYFPTNVYMKASPMTFMVAGKQFVATVAGPNVVCFGMP
ncbi:MAG: PQQ-binding-like beta-propeller repeat protein, partial [Acidobacteriota bacterium]|nr:PQQ-binding-like beta-propeller repeat protein [Acidobacteriota bacterium]